MATVADAARQGVAPPETPDEKKRREAASKAVQAHPEVKAAAKAVAQAADHPAVQQAKALEAHPAVQTVKALETHPKVVQAKALDAHPAVAQAKAIASTGAAIPPALAAHPAVQQAIALSNHPAVTEHAAAAAHPVAQQHAAAAAHPAVQAHAAAVAAPAHQAGVATSKDAHPAVAKVAALDSHPAVQQVAALAAHPAVQQAKALDAHPAVAQAKAIAATGAPIPPALAAHPAVQQAIAVAAHPAVQQHAAAAAHPVAQAHAHALSQIPAHQAHLVTSTHAAGAPRGSHTGVKRMATNTSPTGKIVSMGVVQAAVPAGATADIRVRPQVHFAVTNLIVDPTLAPFFRITGLNVGVKPQLAAAGEQPAGSYAPNATFQLAWDPCDTGTDIIVSVRNIDSASPHDFAATLIGHEHE